MVDLISKTTLHKMVVEWWKIRPLWLLFIAGTFDFTVS